MLAPSCLTSLDRRKTNTKHTVESRRKIKTSFALYCIRSTLLRHTWHVQGSLHSCRPMIFYVAWTLIPKSTTPVFTTSVVMLESGRYLNRLVRGACDWFPILHWDTYLSFLLPSPAVSVMVWYTIYNAPYTRGPKL